MELQEITNEFGFKDYIDEDGYPVCPQCKVLVLPNKGQGCLCAECQYEDDLECQKNYDEEAQFH